MAGSIWTKADSHVLADIFQRHMRELLPDKTCVFHVLRVPPATGAVLWALSLTGADCYQKDVKDRIISQVEEKLRSPAGRL